MPESVRRNEQLFIDIVIVLDSKRNPLGNFNGTHLKINITEALGSLSSFLIRFLKR